METFANTLIPGSVLAAPISALNTTCIISNPANFPSLSAGQQFHMSIQDTPTSNIEIVLVTATNGATFTIERGQEGSAESAHIAGASVSNALTAAVMQQVYSAANAAQPKIIAGTATPKTFFGGTGSASLVTVWSQTITGNSFLPNSIIELSVDCDFTKSYIGKGINIELGGNIIAQSYPTSAAGSISAKWLGYVASDLQSILVFSQNLNEVLAPVAGATVAGSSGAGQPFCAATTNHTTITIDLTQNQTLIIRGQPQYSDTFTLNGFSLINSAIAAAIDMIALPTACWGDSLTSGSGSEGNFIAAVTGTTSNNSDNITSVSSTTGLLPGQVITGTGIPANTIIVGISGSTVTISNNATASGSSVALTVMSGPYPQQMMYNSPGRVVADLGVFGQTSAQITARVLADVVRGKYWTCVFWEGRNDVGNANLTSTVLGNLATAIANLANGVKYAVVTVLPAANEAVNSANWNSIVALNAAINSAYGAMVADVFSALTASGTVNIPLQYRNCVSTTGSISNGSPTLTVASASGLSTGMYCISPGTTAINNGSTSSAPTITNISGTTITLSANASAGLSSSMVSFILPTEIHLNDLGYSVAASTTLATLVSEGA